MENDNIYDKIQELFGNFPSQFNILEEQIDIDLQMEYFEHSKNFKNNLDSDDIMKNKDKIFKTDIALDDKKKLFVKLASIENVEAYRTIEKYLNKPEDELKDWATLALQESRMLLESKLLDTNQVFISTGLGGKGSKLRYFIVFVSKELEAINEFQQRIVKTETQDYLEKCKSELEEIDFEGPYASMYAIIPIQISIKELFNRIITECNQYGDFLRDNFIITNVKALSYDEITEFLKNKDSDN